ncbi:MAG: CHAT domain-containing protein [Deltaproteobacteria bacterium]
MARIGRDGDSSYFGWIAAVGQGESHLALGQRGEAEAALRKAEDFVDEQLTAVPLGDGRYRSASTLNRSAALLITLLVEDGRILDATRVARRSRRRAVSALSWSNRIRTMKPSERTSWFAALADYRALREAAERESPAWESTRAQQVARHAEGEARRRAARASLQRALAVLGGTVAVDEAFQTPAHGERLLVLHEGSQGLFVFLVGPTVALVDVVAKRSMIELSPPMRRELQGAETVRVRTADDGIDPSLLTVLETLAPRARVELFLDLPPRKRATIERRSSALVVADPRGDLVAAKAEGALVVEVWREAGLDVRSLGGDATFEAVRSALESSDVDRFHYAGHATFEGRDGSESGLELARGTRLTLTDVLSLTHVPSEVVLSACESGGAGSASGIGLASAFIVAGADRAIATTGVVADEAARVAFERHWRGEDGRALARAGFVVVTR